MIDGLIAGKLQGQPTQKTAKSGNPFVTAKVRAHAGDGDVFVNVIAFSTSAQAALLALGDGESVALAGTLKPTAWTDREGQARPSLDMTASAVLTAYHVTKKRKAVSGEEQPPQAERPSHDAWVARTPRQPAHDPLDDGEPLDF